jgi:hypothetical protein
LFRYWRNEYIRECHGNAKHKSNIEIRTLFYLFIFKDLGKDGTSEDGTGFSLIREVKMMMMILKDEDNIWT